MTENLGNKTEIILKNMDNMDFESLIQFDFIYSDMIYENLNLSWLDKYWELLKEEGVFELIQLWNNYWDDVCFKDHPSYLDGVTEKAIDFHQSRINKMGKELSKIMSKYHPCVFDEKRSKIFMPRGIDES